MNRLWLCFRSVISANARHACIFMFSVWLTGRCWHSNWTPCEKSEQELFDMMQHFWAALTFPHQHTPAAKSVPPHTHTHTWFNKVREFLCPRWNLAFCGSAAECPVVTQRLNPVRPKWLRPHQVLNLNAYLPTAVTIWSPFSVCVHLYVRWCVVDALRLWALRNSKLCPWRS